MGVVSILLACLLWASDSLIRYPLLAKGVSATSMVFFEHLFLVLISFVLLFIQPTAHSYLKKENRLSFLFVGVIGSAYSTVAFTKAFTLLNPSVVILLQKLQPILAVSMAHFWLKEKITKKFILWAMFGLVGALIISWPDIVAFVHYLQVGGADKAVGQVLFGYSLILFSIVGWGGSTVLGRELAVKNLRPLELMRGRFFYGLLALLPIYLVEQPFLQLILPAPQFSHLGLIFLMVIISGLMGMYFYYLGIGMVPAKNSTLLEMSFPFFAVIINWIFLDATLSFGQILGGLILIFSASVIQIKRY